MKIDIEKLKRQVEFLEKSLDEEKAKGFENRYMEGVIKAYKTVLEGYFVEEEIPSW